MPYDSEDPYSTDSSRASTPPPAKSRTKDKGRGIGQALQSVGSRETDRASAMWQNVRPVEYHRGGKVRKTGVARLKRGERVIPAGKRKKVERLMKRSGMRMKSGRR